MQQLTFVKPGTLEWREAPAPALQAPGDVLLKPLAVARCDLDPFLVRGAFPLRENAPFGHECVGEVAAVGDAVRDFAVGDRCVLTFQISCGECTMCRRGLTSACTAVPSRSMYSLGAHSLRWGGALSDLVRVPFPTAMLRHVPEGVDPVAVASAGDNIVDGWRTVGPHVPRMPGVPVLVVGGAAASVGLYAAAIAVALGAPRVDYIDTDQDRLGVAERVGANPIEGPYPDGMPARYPITVDASFNRHGLACALRSLEPGGVCTSSSIYLEPIPLPMLDMYQTGVTFITGLCNAGADLPKVLELVADGRLRPELITTRVAAWDEAPEAMTESGAKLIFARDMVTSAPPG